MYGWWDEENGNLAELAGILLSNGVYTKARGQFSLVLKIIFQRLLTLPNLVANSVKNVQHHYDLGNDFYRLFLDKSLTYSCGYQLQDTDTLEEMQTQKYELICKKLSLKPGDNMIDVGCGWGGMLIYAAEKYGVYGTGITLSQEQANLAIERIDKRGLADRLKIVVSDYREVEGQYDKFVSIGMFEHVGKGNFSVFMKKVSELLKPDGIGLLHTIGTVGLGGRDPWIEKYIFPGGYLPKLHDLTQEMYNANLLVAHCENLKPHYAKTLNLWSKNFRHNKEKIMALSDKYDLQFIRTWDLYLQVCEATFLNGNSQLYQILFCKRRQWQFETPLNFKIDKPSTKIWESH
jgi:cyclopropane-fatty-acyl-phospholipid synthase